MPLKKRVEEMRKEFIKDFCEVKPYQDTELIYFKGFCEKNYNLVPTPNTIMLWIEDTLTPYHQDMMSEVVEKIENFDHNDNHLCRFNDAPQKCECYYKGIETAQTIIKSK